MKKRLLSMILALIIVFGAVPFDSFASALNTAEISESITDAANMGESRNVSEGVQNIVKRAKQMTEIEWTPKADITGWDYEFTYKAGITYKGLPYGQPTNAYGCRGDYVPWEITLDNYLKAVDDVNSLMYTSSANYSAIAPYYSVDCSGFVSWAWNLPVRTTASGIRNYATLISTDSYENAEIGDCLCNASAHVTLITDVTRDATGKVTSIEISESNVGYDNEYCCYSVRYGEGGEYTLTKFMNKFINRGYYIYRSNTRDNVKYTHSCAVPLEGDNCEKCGVSSEASAKDFIKTNYYSHSEIKVKNDISVWSLPCTGEISEYSSEIFKAESGQSFSAVALVENTEGELWYKVIIEGIQGFIPAKETEFIKLLESDIVITGISEPNEVTEGKSFGLRGIFQAKYNKLTKLEAFINRNGTTVLSANAGIGSNVYNLKGSSIDNSIIFNDLQVGNYTYELYLSFERFYTTDGTSIQSDSQRKLVHENPFKVISKNAHECDKSELMYYGAEHPHYGYFKCSLCGLINEDTSVEGTSGSCNLCRPAKPVLTADYKDNCSGEAEVSFSWEAGTNATHYDIAVYKETTNGNYEEAERIFFVSSGESRTLHSGNYKIVLIAYNSNVSEEDGSFACTESDELFITISSSHNYVATVIPPTCVEQGFTSYSCSNCGDIYRADFVNATGNHTYSNAADATCNQCDYVRKDAVKSVPMYRMYDKNGGEHFYTGSTEERDFLIANGWQYEGVGFNFPVAGRPVYRLYEEKTGEHLYTMDEEEKDRLLSEGWTYEGVAFNSADNDEVPQYRLHNPNATRGAYHFTGSAEERDLLISAGWEYQGIGFYSCLR